MVIGPYSFCASEEPLITTAMLFKQGKTSKSIKEPNLKSIIPITIPLVKGEVIGKRIILLIILLTILMPVISAHVQHAEPGVEKGSVWYQVFVLHDWIHPIFFILMIFSCYSVRFFSGRHILGEPKGCPGKCSGCYKGEGWFKQNHRIFFWGTFLLAFVHVGEVIPSLSIISAISGVDLWILVLETSYLLVAFLYLVTCYHFRYVIERLAKKGWINYKAYNALSAGNKYHGLFFWLTISTVVIRFVLVAIETGSMLQAIPGMF